MEIDKAHGNQLSTGKKIAIAATGAAAIGMTALALYKGKDTAKDLFLKNGIEEGTKLADALKKLNIGQKASILGETILAGLQKIGSDTKTLAHKGVTEAGKYIGQLKNTVTEKFNKISKAE